MIVINPVGVRASDSELVQIIVKSWDSLFESLAFSGVSDDLAGLGGGLEGISWQDLPMVEDTLREGLASCVRPQVSSES